MYFIIGGDGKQYGPISDADVRKWIAEGRLNQHSQARAESETDFRALSSFPEFASAFGISAPPGIAPPLGVSAEREAALQKIKVPAIGLIISAIISVLMSLFALVTIKSSAAQMQELNSMMSQYNNPQLQQFTQSFTHFMSGPFGIANYLFQILIAILILIGALKMLKMRSYELCFASAILAVLPCITPCCGWFLGLIFGIWAMIILSKIKPHFS